MAKKEQKGEKKDMTYWLYDVNYVSKQWHYCQSMNQILLSWDALGDYRKYENLNAVAEGLRKVYNRPDKSYYGESLAIWNFYHNMKIGDVVFAKDGEDVIVARGVVAGNYKYDPEASNHRNQRAVEWERIGECKLPLPKDGNILINITGYPDIIKSLNKQLDKLNSGTDVRFWIGIIDSEVSKFRGLNKVETLEVPLYHSEIQIGDEIVVYDYPNKEMVGSAIVIHKSDGKKKRIGLRKVGTLKKSVETLEKSGDLKAHQLLFLTEPDELIMKLTREQYTYLTLEGGNEEAENLKKVYTSKDFLDEVFMGTEQATRLEKLLRRKKNIILQGAPGVGKTFSAKRLAYMMMGEKDESRIEMIQFHQNYSYEDFIMGYKPVKEGSFSLNTGVFYDFCKVAEKDQSRDYFFIIDEINRGNLSKIFGELLQLIEADYRDHRIKLAYNKEESFQVPSNLYIIGMMNTADRSLAMIDYALRRRFSFFDMQPGFNTEGFHNYQKSVGSKSLNKLVEGVKQVNKLILSDDSLGKGFQIGHSYLVQNLKDKDGRKLIFDYDLAESIIEYDLMPLVEEYWFDNEEKLEQAKDILRKALKNDN